MNALVRQPPLSEDGRHSPAAGGDFPIDIIPFVSLAPLQPSSTRQSGNSLTAEPNMDVGQSSQQPGSQPSTTVHNRPQPSSKPCPEIKTIRALQLPEKTLQLDMPQQSSPKGNMAGPTGGGAINQNASKIVSLLFFGHLP